MGCSRFGFWGVRYWVWGVEFGIWVQGKELEVGVWGSGFRV